MRILKFGLHSLVAVALAGAAFGASAAPYRNDGAHRHHRHHKHPHRHVRHAAPGVVHGR